MEFEIIGVPMRAYWRGVLKEIYESDSRHRFDIIEAVLNQQPQILDGIARKMSDWKKGLTTLGGQDSMFIRSTVGDRTFVVGIHMPREPIDEAEWRVRSRTLARTIGVEGFKGTDCALFLRFKKSKEATFDGFSFHRFIEKKESY
jgi:hypothetical protein